MITTKKQNILEVEKGIIAHGCNCLGAMGGLAGSIATKWPIVKKDYVNLIKESKHSWELLGTAQHVKINDDLSVFNLFSQYDVGNGRKTEYSAMHNALLDLNDQVNVEYEKTIYLPYLLGCGLGGGDWKIVYSMIDDVFQFNNVVICSL